MFIEMLIDEARRLSREIKALELSIAARREKLTPDAALIEINWPSCLSKRSERAPRPVGHETPTGEVQRNTH